MAKLFDIIRRFNESKDSNVESAGSPEKMSPAETELLAFKERERQDNIKRELAHFRKKNTMLNDNQGMHRSILGKAPSIFHTEPRHDIMGKGNNLNRKRANHNILSGGGSLW